MITAIHFYRISHRLYRWRIPKVPRLIDYLSRVIFSCWIPHRATIGRNVMFGYGGLAIVIHDDVVIGDNTEIDQGVTVGGSARAPGVARIGSNVYIGAGAKLLGPITIGDGAVIGANAVVTKDVPSGAVAVGVPAKVVRSGIDVSEFLYHRRVRS